MTVGVENGEGTTEDPRLQRKAGGDINDRKGLTAIPGSIGSHWKVLYESRGVIQSDLCFRKITLDHEAGGQESR